MIAYVKGKVEDIAEDNVVIEVGGIGYNVKISADTAGRGQNCTHTQMYGRMPYSCSVF